MSLDTYKGIGREIYIRDKFVCRYCGRNGMGSLTNYFMMDLEHVVPRSRGGGDDAENLVVACKSCNTYKESFDRSFDFENYRGSKEELIRLVMRAIDLRRAEEAGIYLKVKKEMDKI
jgi:hypothetical protein